MEDFWDLSVVVVAHRRRLSLAHALASGSQCVEWRLSFLENNIARVFVFIFCVFFILGKPSERASPSREGLIKRLTKRWRASAAFPTKLDELSLTHTLRIHHPPIFPSLRMPLSAP